MGPHRSEAARERVEPDQRRHRARHPPGELIAAALPFRLWVVADVEVAGGEDALVSRLRTIAETAGPEAAIYLRALAPALTERITRTLAGTATPLFSSIPTPAIPNLHLPEAAKSDSPLPLFAAGLRSRAVHSVEGARAARGEQVDLLVFGHVYETESKAGVAGRGIAELREVVAAAAGVPVFAIGGITLARVAEVREAGAYGVGVLRDLLATEDGKAATRAFLRAFRPPG